MVDFEGSDLEDALLHVTSLGVQNALIVGMA